MGLNKVEKSLLHETRQNDRPFITGYCNGIKVNYTKKMSMAMEKGCLSTKKTNQGYVFQYLSMVKQNMYFIVKMTGAAFHPMASHWVCPRKIHF